MLLNVDNLLTHDSGEPEIVTDNRRVQPGSVERVAEANLPTEAGEFRLIGYRSLVSDEEFIALARGSLRAEKPTLVRIHSQCLTGDAFGSTKCDCGQQLQAAMRLIAEENCGAIVYQQQEGRGIGIINKIRAYALQDAGADTIEANERLGLEVDLRRYEQCAEILRELGLRRVRLMSNNPEKIRALKNCGLEMVERVPLAVKIHSSLARYLKTKRARMGHFINLPEEFQRQAN
ncbi:MAG TPA: GTP cyclohydrolase II [Pyrinomonadaceae bacterium]|jgi:3,4-dihydroxy 2-butanone 4-phosphate synthase/GTP cyclohydrolase II